MPDGFLEAWLIYPRKVAKKAAERAYLKAVKTYPHAAIVASIELMKATDWHKRAPEYIPHMASFLNRECFEDPRDSELLEDDAPLPHDHICLRHAVLWDCVEACGKPLQTECKKCVGEKVGVTDAY